MADKFNVYLGTNLLDHTFGNTPYGASASLYFALCTATVLITDAGSGLSEATYTGYARTTVTNNGTNFPSATSPANIPTKSNGTSIEFTEVTSGGDTVVAVAILDSATIGAGNVLAGGDLAVSKVISTGDKLIFEPGGVVITLS